MDEDLYLTFMASRRSSEKEITQFWEEQADFFTITMTPPTQHSAAIIFCESKTSVLLQLPYSLDLSPAHLFMSLKLKVDLKGCHFVFAEEMQAK